MAMIQIRNVPDKLHRQIKARAALEGMTLSDFMLRELTRVLERPSRAELLERIAALPPIDPPTSPEDVIRSERDAR